MTNANFPSSETQGGTTAGVGDQRPGEAAGEAPGEAPGESPGDAPRGLDVAVIGSGIAGMSAAWLLSKGNRVTVFEQAPRVGGHSNTLDVGGDDAGDVQCDVRGDDAGDATQDTTPDTTGRAGQSLPVDTGFIVYNEPNYPNLTALFAHLDVPTQESNMSFAASIDGGRIEYAGAGLGALFAQKSNLLSRRFWRMLMDLRRFYRDAGAVLDHPCADDLSLGDYLRAGGYSEAFMRDHLLPMGAAIWSSSVDEMKAYPAAAFVRFFTSHGLLQVKDRPRWRTVTGGSRAYVERLTAPYADRIQKGNGAKRIRRRAEGVLIEDQRGAVRPFDRVIIATHADEALALLDDPDENEQRLLGAFAYQVNRTILHQDARLMPKRKSVWSSWNYLTETDDGGDAKVCVSYWMNLLQNIPEETPLFVTLNALHPPKPETVIAEIDYTHPVFDTRALAAQRRLWELQGERNTWFCGSYFGHGFHEDALQAGLAAAEDVGGLRRPWTVPNESGRIYLNPKRRAAA